MSSQLQNRNTPNQKSDNQNQDNQNQFSNWFELLYFLFNDRKGMRITGFLLGILGVFALSAIAAIYYLRPEKIEITTGLGTVVINNGDTQNAILSLSPNGGDESTPWVRTGIKIETGDVIKITATGRINTSIKRVIATTLHSAIDERTWVSPSGLDPSLNRIYFPTYNKEKLLPDLNGTHYGFGMLLAAVKDDKGQIKTENIVPFTRDSDYIQFTAENDGELVLTVNDIWLNPTDKEVYAPPFTNENFKHYLQLAQFEASFRGEEFYSWSEKMKREKAREQHQKRLKGWDAIERNNNWNIWFDDNIGSFSVSITVNPKTE